MNCYIYNESHSLQQLTKITNILFWVSVMSHHNSVHLRSTKFVKHLSSQDLYSRHPPPNYLAAAHGPNASANDFKWGYAQYATLGLGIWPYLYWTLGKTPNVIYHRVNHIIEWITFTSINMTNFNMRFINYLLYNLIIKKHICF